jgi:hypothetical protein
MRTLGIARIGVVALVAISLACAVFAMLDAGRRVQFPHQNDYEEGNVLNAAVRINHGLTPYPDPHGWPVVLNPYGPVPYDLVATAVHFSGPHFFVPRLIVLTCTLFCAVFLGLIIRHATRSTLLGVSFGALFLSHTLVLFWMAILRVDFIGLAFSLAGLWVFLRFPRLWILAAMLFLAGIFTKLTLLAAPLACFGVLIFQHKSRNAFRFAALLIFLCVALFGYMQFSTGGAFAFDQLRSHPDPIVWAHYLTFFRLVLLSNPFLMVAGLVGIVWAAASKRLAEAPVLYSIFGLLATATAGKLGSNDNHMLELVAVLCIMSAMIVSWLWTKSPSLQVAAALLCLLIGVWRIMELPFPSGPVTLAGCRESYNFVRNFPSDRILSEDVGALVTNGKTAWVSNPFVYAQLAMSGNLSDAQLRTRLQQKWFDVLILDRDPRVDSERWSPEARVLMRQNYHFAGQFGCEFSRIVYLPNRSAEAATSK